MKNLHDILSPKSWAILLAGFYFSFLVIFSPSLKELGVFIGIDFLALMVLAISDRLAFFRLFPVMKYLRDDNFAALHSLPLEHKISFYHELSAFPRKRATFAVLTSYLVNIPSTLLVLFYWSYEGSMWIQFFKWLIMMQVGFFYLFVISIIELHQFVSAKFRTIHQQQDWTEVFAAITPLSSTMGIHKTCNIGTMAIFFLLFMGQWFIVSSDPASYWLHLAHFFCLGLFCTMLILRIRHLERGLLLDGLQRIFAEFPHLNNTDHKTLALHTVPQIANFDLTFNELLRKIQQKEEEIALWVVKELDENRFKVMGEVSALVIHDLATPLHVVNFCMHEVMNDSTELLADGEFRQHLLRNLDHAKTLMQSISNFLRNPKDMDGSGANIGTAHIQAKEIISSQFFHQGISQRFSFNLDPHLAEISVAIGPADLLHIFYNLYKNAVTALMALPDEQPHITVRAHALDEREVVFTIEDSGKGLSPERFVQLVNSPVRLEHRDFFGKSVGLRLIHSLVKRHGGDLSIVPLNDGRNCFCIKLLASMEVPAYAE